VCAVDADVEARKDARLRLLLRGRSGVLGRGGGVRDRFRERAGCEVDMLCCCGGGGGGGGRAVAAFLRGRGRVCGFVCSALLWPGVVDC